MNATRIIKVWLPGGGMTTVKAAPTPAPGLMVNEDPTIRGSWNLTHLASGCAVAVRMDSPEQALDLAIKLGPVCDWTLSPQALLDEIPAFRPRWADVLRKAGVMDVQPPVATGRQLIAGMEPLT